MGRLLYQKTVKTFCVFTATKQNYLIFSGVLIRELSETNKEIVVTDGEMIMHTQIPQNIHILSPCCHVDIGTHILLHVSHAAQFGHQQILIRTDVILFAVYVINKLGAKDGMYISNVPCFERL